MYAAPDEYAVEYKWVVIFDIYKVLLNYSLLVFKYFFPLSNKTYYCRSSEHVTPKMYLCGMWIILT